MQVERREEYLTPAGQAMIAAVGRYLKSDWIIDRGRIAELDVERIPGSGRVPIRGVSFIMNHGRVEIEHGVCRATSDAFVFSGIVNGAELLSVRRELFDIGLMQIAVGDKISAVDEAITVFLLSKHIKSFDGVLIDSSDVVSLPMLGQAGRLGNQCFQFMYLVLYCACNNLRMEHPQWIGSSLFGLKERPPRGQLPMLVPCDDNYDPQRYFSSRWPPRNVGMIGYFQCMPSMFPRHRDFIRNIFTPAGDVHEQVQAWYEAIRRTKKRLLTVHVRRGDYTEYEYGIKTVFSRVPTAWIVTWLRAYVERRPDVVLYVASDDPTACDELAEFNPLRNVSSRPGNWSAEAVDFFTMVNSDILLLCNSSFSRMASLLASEEQEAYIVDFDAETFIPYKPWDDLIFWERYGSEEVGLGQLARSQLEEQIVALWAYEGYLRYWLKHPLRWIARGALARVLTSKAVGWIAERLPYGMGRRWLAEQRGSSRRFELSFSANWRKGGAKYEPWRLWESRMGPSDLSGEDNSG